MLLHFTPRPRLFLTHKMTVYDIFMCRHTLKNMHTRVSLKTVKCYPKFNLAEGVLSQGGGVVVHPKSSQGPIMTKLGLMLLSREGPILFSAFKTNQGVQDL